MLRTAKLLTRAPWKDDVPPTEAQPKAKDATEEATVELTTVLLEQVESRVVEWLLMQLTKGTLEGGPKRGMRKHSDIGRLAGALWLLATIIRVELAGAQNG